VGEKRDVRAQYVTGLVRHTVTNLTYFYVAPDYAIIIKYTNHYGCVCILAPIIWHTNPVYTPPCCTYIIKCISVHLSSKQMYVGLLPV